MLIAGGGFAGLSAAHSAAIRGLNVGVVDRKPDPGVGVHTTGLLVKEVADEWDIPRRMTRKVHGIRLYAPNMKHVDLSSPGYYFLATDTGNLLRHLAMKAWSVGASVIASTPVKSVHRDTQSTQPKVSVNNGSLSCDFLLAADGARSTVARLSGIDTNQQFLSGVEVCMTGVRGIEEDCLHVFLNATLARGYIAWIVPGVNDTYQIGLAARQPHQPDLNGFLTELQHHFDFSRATELHRRGGLIPIGGTLKQFFNDNIMLIGDAAGMVSPLTAGGIHPAVQLGRLAGVACANHLLENAEHPARLIARHASRYRYKRMMRKSFDLCASNRLYNTMIENRLSNALAQTIFFHHRGLFSYSAWRDILKTCITLEPTQPKLI